MTVEKTTAIELTLEQALERAESLRRFREQSPGAFARSEDFGFIVLLADEVLRRTPTLLVSQLKT